MEKRIKRLEIAVITLLILFFVSIFFSIYSASQIRTVASKIPDYKEIKEDIKTLNQIYKISEVKIPKAYDYTKNKVNQGYEYSKNKLTELVDLIPIKHEKKNKK